MNCKRCVVYLLEPWCLCKQGLEHLKREMLEFEKQKAEEMAKLQEFKTEETKKLK